MKLAGRLVWAITLTGSLAVAGTSIASVSGTHGLTLDGHAVSAAGVNSWPLVAGDTLSTSDVPATVSFGDGSHITLAPRSRALVCGTTTGPRLALLAGAMDYKLASDSKVRLFDRTAEQGSNVSTITSCSELDAAGDDPAQSGASSAGTAAHHGVLIGTIIASAAAAGVITGAAIATSGSGAAPAALPLASPQ